MILALSEPRTNTRLLRRGWAGLECAESASGACGWAGIGVLISAGWCPSGTRWGMRAAYVLFLSDTSRAVCCMGLLGSAEEWH